MTVKKTPKELQEGLAGRLLIHSHTNSPLFSLHNILFKCAQDEINIIGYSHESGLWKCVFVYLWVYKPDLKQRNKKKKNLLSKLYAQKQAHR